MNDHDHLVILCDSKAVILERTVKNEAFQVIQLITGHAFISEGASIYFLQPGDLFFTCPGEKHTWIASPDATIHFCSVSPKYFVGTPHISSLFRKHPAFNGNRAMTALTEIQSTLFSMLFKMIRTEVDRKFVDKQKAIHLYLQLMMLHINRVGKQDTGFNVQKLRTGPWNGFEKLLGPLFHGGNWLD